MSKIVTTFICFLSSTLLLFGQANVQGRHVEGHLPKPAYNSKATGTVVVQVKIDQYGQVTEAIPGADGTTITDKDLWNASRNAALKAHFNADANAPALQTGTITYVFMNESERGRSVSVSDVENATVRELVDLHQKGKFIITARFVETIDSRELLFSVEDEDFIIPVKLIKNDLGAENRFRSLNLHKGDTLTIKGDLSRIEVKYNYYKGLENAVILDKGSTGDVANISDISSEVIPFQIVEQRPSFNGGDANEFSKWVNEHLVYPMYAKENGIQGRVTLQFTIEADGRVTNVRVLRGVEESLDKEAVRVVSSSPKWKPGRQRDKAVPVIYTFPVIFQLH